MQKINKKNILIFVFLLLITIYRICLIKDFPFGFNDFRTYDEKMTYDMFISLRSGTYLGTYGALTITKGIFYPLFLCIISLTKIPYLICLTIIYILSIVSLCFTLRKHVSKICLIFLYLILLFNPVSFSQTTFMVLYRNSIGMIHILLFLSCFISIYNNKDKRFSFISWFLMGVLLTTIIYTREDYIWYIVVIIMTVIYYFIKYLKKKNYLFLIFIPCLIIPILSSRLILINLNKNYYNVYYTTELKEGYFNKFMLDVLQIKVYKQHEQGTLTEEGLAKALKVSKTLRQAEDELWVLFDFNSGWLIHDFEKDMYYLPNTSPMWSFRTYIYKKLKFKDGVEANEFFKKAYYELEEGYKSGIIKRDKYVLSIFTNRLIPSQYSTLIKNTFSVVPYTVTYKGMEYGYYLMEKDKNLEKLLNVKTYNIIDAPKTVPKINTFYYIGQIYKKVFPIITIISVIIYIIDIILKIKNKEINFMFILITIILFMYFEYAFIMAFVDLTTTQSIIPYYLNPAYSLQVIFVILNLFNISNIIKKIRRQI